MHAGKLTMVVGIMAMSCAAPIDQTDQSESVESASEPALSEEQIAEISANPEFVKVPGRLMHRSCVHEVPSGTTVTELSDGRVKIRRTLADPEEDVPACAHPSVRMKREPSPPPGTINWAWIEYTKTTPLPSPALKPWFSRLTGSWGVPEKPWPPTFSPGPYYWFNSLMPSNQISIIQPVLRYSGSWDIAAWYVSSNRAVHSSFIDVVPGQQINGIMKATGCNSSGACTWLIHVAKGTEVATSLTMAFPYSFTIANQGVLEVYDLHSCSELPATPYTTFYNNALFQPNNQNVNSPVDWDVSWQSIVTPGLALNCDWQATRDPSTNRTRLAWNFLR
jgi:hypothetical protein